MSVIEDLRKQAQVVLSRQDEVSHGREDLNQLRRSAIIGQIRIVYDFLHQILDQLNIVKPDIQIDFTITDDIPKVSMKQSHYEVHVRSSSDDEVVGFIFKLTDGDKIRIPKDNIEDIDSYMKKLTSCDINVLGQSNEYIETGSSIPGRVFFKSDFQDNKIFIIIDNYDKIGTQHYLISPDNVDNNLLEELGLFILRQPNRFFELLTVNTEAPPELRSQSDSILEEGESTLTESMNESRIQTLFSRGQHLYLTYHEKITEVSSRTSDVLLGRSKKSNIAVKADCASRKHAEIVYRNGKFVVIDKSTNGTFIKTQGGKEIFIHCEEFPLSGSGFISLGASVSVDNEHMIYFSCQ